MFSIFLLEFFRFKLLDKLRNVFCKRRELQIASHSFAKYGGVAQLIIQAGSQNEHLNI